MANKIKTLFKLIKTIKNFPIYLLDHFGLLKRKDVLFRLRNGLRYKVRAGSTDRFIVNEILIHKSYTPLGFEIEKDDIVVDVGAHIGIFSIMTSKYAQNGKIYSFEPMKENFELLNENILLNSAKNIEAINKAVSNKSGKIKFYISQSKNKGQNSLYRIDENQKEEIVDKISFKTFLKKLPRIDFLKMDCEGAEYEIVFSLTKKELQKIKKISMEYHNYGKYTGHDLAKFLQENGFKTRLIEEGKKFGKIYASNILAGFNKLDKNRLPNSYIAGFPRCASTYLADVLKQHPDVSVSKRKEPNYFNHKFFFFGYPNFLSPFRKNPLREYAKLFQDNLVKIDGSILSAYDHKSAKRIKNVLGDIKIIFLIRDKERFKKSLHKIMVHNGDIPNVPYKKFLKKYHKLIDYYSDFEKHIKIFEKEFSDVEVFNIVDNDTQKEIGKILKFLKLSKFNFNYNVDRNSERKEKPAKLKHRIKRKILVMLPFLANKEWKTRLSFLKQVIPHCKIF